MNILYIFDKIRNKLFLYVIRSIIEDNKRQILDAFAANQADAINIFCGKIDALAAKMDALDIKQESILAQLTASSAKLSETEKSLKSYVERKVLKIGENTSKFISAAMINRETFRPFKNWCKGKKLVICGTGPSLQEYIPIYGAVHIALNSAFLFNKVQFDFIFCQDFEGVNMYQKELIEYAGNNCQKFLGQQTYDVLFKNIPESFRDKCKAKNFATDLFTYNKIEDYFRPNFVTEIDSRAIGNFSNVGLSVMQFALWMNPNEIYLVGLDHSGSHFNSENLSPRFSEADKKNSSELWKIFLRRTRKQWRSVREFAQVYYPDTKIISVNPVALKGIFTDLNQKSEEMTENEVFPIASSLDIYIDEISKYFPLPDYPVIEEKCIFNIDKKIRRENLMHIEGWAYKDNNEIDVYARVDDKVYRSLKTLRNDVKEMFSLESVTNGFLFNLPYSGNARITLYFVNETEEEIYQAEI